MFIILQDSRPALKAYGPGLVLLIANQFSGLFTMVNYMSDIFANSGSTMDPDTCTIIIGAVQILGTYVTTLLCDICGRKLLMLVSTGGVAISLTAFGFFTKYAESHNIGEYSWIPLLLMSMDIFLGNIGLVGCFFVSLVEMFPVKVRSKAKRFKNYILTIHCNRICCRFVPRPPQWQLWFAVSLCSSC